MKRTLLLLAAGFWLVTTAVALAQADFHRQEMQYRALRSRDEHGNIPTNALVNAVKQARQLSFAPAAFPGSVKATGTSPATNIKSPLPSGNTPVGGLQTNVWTWKGPGNIGGRIRSIVVHPTVTNTMWLGGVDGGVWKSLDGGASWAPLDDFMANLAVSCMIIDPANPDILYVGTGEPMYNVDSVRGAGIFKTTDGGITWTQLSATTGGPFNFVSRLAMDPNNDSILLASTRSGIFRSTDGGNTWSQTSTTEMLDIAFHPSDSSQAIASGYGESYYSLDGGMTWNAASGFPPADGFNGGRIEIAYAPGSPTTVYASYDNNSGEIYVSNDGGQTYSLVSNPQHLSGQGWYDNCIWVDPTNPNLIVFGGTDVYRSTDGGNTFTDIGGYAGSIHPDQHAFTSIPGYNGSTVATLFVGNDGGIFCAGNITTVTAGSGWTTLNNNVGITQFYGAAGNTTSGTIVGGTQDNGSLRLRAGQGTGSWTAWFDGDGGFCAADQSDTNFFYGEYVYLQIFRSTNGGNSANYITGGLGDAGLPATNGTRLPFLPPVAKTPPGNDPDGSGSPAPDPDSAANFIAPFILDPNNFNTMLAGGSNLWRSVNVKDASPSWIVLKQGIATGSYISAIAVAPGNSDQIWVGYNDGSVYYTVNGTSLSPTWTQTGLGTLPSRSCGRLTVDPFNINTIYACFGGYSAGNVYKTSDGGNTWSNIASALPSAPANTLVVAPFNNNFIYVGMDVGVFASTNGGATWSSGNLGAANVAVDELLWMNYTLVAATHGRGLFTANLTPDALVVSPLSGFSASGFVGGPIGSFSTTFTLTNAGADSLSWSLSTTSSWLQASSSSGTLAPGGGPAETVTVSIAPGATNLPAGTFNSRVTFTNVTDGYVQSAQFTLQLQQAPDSLIIGPAGGLAISGPPGGMSGSSQNFVLTNIRSSPISWSLINTSALLTAVPPSGTLGAGLVSNVTVSATAAANALATGSYTNTVWFTNQSTHVAQARPVVLVVQPLVLNGGFETGDFVGWLAGGNFQFCTVAATAPFVHSGNFGAQMGPSFTLGYLDQNVITVPGQIYVLSCWLNSPDGQTPNEFTASWDGNILTDLVNQGATGWNHLQFVVVASSTSTPIQFGFRDDPTYLGFDDVSVTAVPPPKLQGVAQSGGADMNLTWSAMVGVAYQLQSTTTLNPPNWTNVGGPITAGSTTITYTDSGTIPNNQQLFYRVQVQP